ncbi:unnamed protein product [Cylicostephanus goldi]|uniref:Uncharacterized protein n=1 Tax=Cylicostephanus goldi TaxID=71465 RepID=A0A3P7QI90_CYLGO|nr:unnamed protein product [Cylicostephanus goldi]
MVTQAKQVAMSPRDTGAANAWRSANDHLLDSVKAVGDAIAGIQNGRHSAYQDSLSRASPYQPPQVNLSSVSASSSLSNIFFFLAIIASSALSSTTSSYTSRHS